MLPGGGQRKRTRNTPQGGPDPQDYEYQSSALLVRIFTAHQDE